MNIYIAQSVNEYEFVSDVDNRMHFTKKFPFYQLCIFYINDLKKFINRKPSILVFHLNLFS